MESIWFIYSFATFLFTLASFDRIVKRALNLAVDTCTFLSLTLGKTINSDTKMVEGVFRSETFRCPDNYAYV